MTLPEQLQELIEAKIEGGEAFSTEEKPAELDVTEDVSDLLAKLEASVRGARAESAAKKAPRSYEEVSAAVGNRHLVKPDVDAEGLVVVENTAQCGIHRMGRLKVTAAAAIHRHHRAQAQRCAFDLVDERVEHCAWSGEVIEAMGRRTARRTSGRTG